MKELGVKQESLFYWFPHREMETNKLIEWKIIRNMGGSDEACSAFTVAELGELLPRRNKYWSNKLPDEKWSNEYWCYEKMVWWKEKDEQGRMKNGYTINYLNDHDKYLLDEEIYEEKEVDARAKMLIYLIEHNLYDPQNT